MTNHSRREARPLNEEIVFVPFEAVAYDRILSKLVQFFKQLRKLLWARIILLTVLLALFSWVGSSLYAFLIPGNGTQGLRGVFGVAAVATVASALTIVGLYPVLRKSEHYLFEMASLISRANIDLLSLLGKLTELRGGDTAGHTLRVTVYTLLFAEALQLPRDTLVRAVKGAWLHDIGKLVIPDRVIGKPGALTDQERAEMEKHVFRGLDIVNQSQLLDAAVHVVEFHHEHFDGSGYPYGLLGRSIPVEARLFALVDVFDALTSSRVYKSPLTVPEALDTMAKARGSHFDPYLFDRFAEMAPDFERKVVRDERDLAALLLELLTPHLDQFLLGHTLFAPPNASTWKAICLSLINVERTIESDEPGRNHDRIAV